jgi:hypothetical protein
MAEFIEFLSKSAYNDLVKSNAELIKMAKNVEVINTTFKNVKVPTDSDKAVRKLNENSTKLNATLQKTQTQLLNIASTQSKTAKQMERTSIKESSARNSLNKQRDKSIVDIGKENAKLQVSQSVYNKVQAKVNLLSKTYNDLAIRKQIGIKLSIKEEAQLLSLNNRLNKYQTALKHVDSGIQKNQRNVGNYASGWNGLGNSINQITRELPAFTFSAQTGFLALSNNIPILTDEIGKLADKNKLLAKEGKPVTSVFSQILSGVFSLQTAMGVGILLFTLYGKEIGSFVTGLFKASSGLKSFSKQLGELNDARAKSSELASKEISELDTLYKRATDVLIPIKQRKEAIDKLQELYPNYLKNISDENILNGKAEAQYYALRNAILEKYTVQAISDKLTENSKDRLDEYMDLQEELINSEKAVTDALNVNNGYRKRFVDFDKNGRALRIKQGYEEQAALRVLNFALSERNNIEKEVSDFNKNALKEDGLLIRTQAQMIRQSALLNIEKEKEIKSSNASTEANKEQNEIQKETEKLIFRSIGFYEDLIKQQNEHLEAIKNGSTLKLEENKEYQDQLKLIERTTDNLNILLGVKKDLQETTGLSLDLTDDVAMTEGAFADIEKNFDDFYKSFQDKIVGQSGFESLFEILNGGLKNYGDNWKAKALVIMEATQEMFNFISNLSQKNFEAEYRRNDDKARIAKMFAGDSAEAISAIELEQERRRKEIANRENQAKKKQAIFNIAIDTAQAVMAAAPNIVTMAIMGALGLAQIATVASQEIPQYWQGGTHDGGIMMVNDDPLGIKGNSYREIIQTPDGKLSSPKGKNVKMNAPKGTQIFTQEQFANNLDGIMANAGISSNQTQNINLDNSILASKLDMVVNAINSKGGLDIIYDKLGMNIYEKSQGKRETNFNNRKQIKGKYV